MDKISITLRYYPQTKWGKLMQTLKIIEHKRTVFVEESTLETRRAYALALRNLPNIDLARQLNEVDQEIGIYIEYIVKAFAIVINNRGDEPPPKWIIDSLHKESLTELLEFWSTIRSLLNSELFVTTIVMLLGLKIEI